MSSCFVWLSAKSGESRDSVFAVPVTRSPFSRPPSTATCAMNSRSIRPPGMSLMSQRSRGWFLLLDQRAHLDSFGSDFLWIARQRQNFCHLCLDLGRQRWIAGDDARAGQRHVLPGPGLSALVFLERIDMGRHRTLVARRAQPEIELVEHAFGGRRRDGGDQALGHARVIVRGGQRLFAVRFVGIRVVIVEQDQVDIRTRRQLAAAELAHAEDRDPAARRLCHAGARTPPALRRARRRW